MASTKSPRPHHLYPNTTPAPLPLPPLLIEIRRDGVPVDVVEIPDPRAGFVKCWEEIHGNNGLTAVAVIASGKRGAS